jgi:hypothetical protein
LTQGILLGVPCEVHPVRRQTSGQIPGPPRRSQYRSDDHGEASLPILTEAVKPLIDAPRMSAFEARGKKLADAKATVVHQAKADSECRLVPLRPQEARPQGKFEIT